MKRAMTLLLATVAITSANAQPTNPPGFTLTQTNQTGTNYLSLTITNHLPGRLYTVYYTYEVDTPLRWWFGPWVTGQTNQTNFLLLEPQAPIVFLQARNGTDQDGDSVDDFRDADPFDSQVGRMEVIIYTPANNSIIQ